MQFVCSGWLNFPTVHPQLSHWILGREPGKGHRLRTRPDTHWSHGRQVKRSKDVECLLSRWTIMRNVSLWVVATVPSQLPRLNKARSNAILCLYGFQFLFSNFPALTIIKLISLSHQNVHVSKIHDKFEVWYFYLASMRHRYETITGFHT